jgi:chromosome segregation ATPase
MVKKAVVIAAGVLLLLGLVFGRSHVSTAVGIAQDTFQDSVPIPFEIKRAREEIRRLRPEIEKNMRSIAEVEVEVARLERQVGKSDGRLQQDHAEIIQLKDDLESGSEFFIYANRNYTASQVKADLIRRFDQFQTQEATLVSKKKQLDAKQRMLLAARDKLEGMLAAKSQLEVDVENLEARLKMVEVAQTTSEFNFDDSKLSKTRDLVEQIRTRIEIAEKLVNADIEYYDRIPLQEADVDRDITDEITDYFGEHRPEVESLVDSIR